MTETTAAEVAAKVIAVVGGITLLLAGWLLTIVIESVQGIRDKQDEMIERIATVEANLENIIVVQKIDDRLDEIWKDDRE